MSDLTTRAVKFDAVTNTVDLVLRELYRARSALVVFPDGARRLYEQTRIEVLEKLRERLIEILGAEIVALVEAEVEKEERP